MKKKIGCFLIAISAIIFIYGLANAQSFLLQFTDSNGDGNINFNIYALSSSTQTYYTGFADPNTYKPFPAVLAIPAGTLNSTAISWSVPVGGSVTYDVYLTDGVNYYWTSQGAALGTIGTSAVSIDWQSGLSGIPVKQFNVSSVGDTVTLVPVPIPSALFLLGTGIIALGLIRRKRFLTATNT